MPTIQLNNFGGIIPRIHPTLLPYNCATKAHNCKLKNGKLVPIKKASMVKDDLLYFIGDDSFEKTDVSTAFPWNVKNLTTFLLFKGIVDIAKPNFYSEDKPRLFVTGETDIDGDQPIVLWKDGRDIEMMSLYKKDPPELYVENNSSHDSNEDNLKYTYFFQTWVDELGYESGCSKPSNEVVYVDGDSITISAWINPPEKAIKRRIYKVVSGLETDGNIQFVKEQWKGDTKFYSNTFQIKDEDAGEIMPMITSIPEDLQGMCFVSGGFYVGYCRSDLRKVRFSEIGLPNSYPEEYSYEVDEDIVGLAATQSNVWVLTKGHPYVISGSSPESMIVTKIPAMQGCIAKRGICILDGSVFYISHDGICMLTEGNGTVEVVTNDYFTKEQWNEIVDENTIMIAYDSALFVWGKKDLDVGGFRIEFLDKTSAITTFDYKTQCVCVDAVSDKMYFINKE